MPSQTFIAGQDASLESSIARLAAPARENKRVADAPRDDDPHLAEGAPA